MRDILYSRDLSFRCPDFDHLQGRQAHREMRPALVRNYNTCRDGRSSSRTSGRGGVTQSFSSCCSRFLYLFDRPALAGRMSTCTSRANTTHTSSAIGVFTLSWPERAICLGLRTVIIQRHQATRKRRIARGGSEVEEQAGHEEVR